MDDLLTTADLAAYLHKTPKAVAQMRYNGTGPPFVKFGRRNVRYRRVDVERWIKDHIRRPKSA